MITPETMELTQALEQKCSDLLTAKKKEVEKNSFNTVKNVVFVRNAKNVIC